MWWILLSIASASDCSASAISKRIDSLNDTWKQRSRWYSEVDALEKQLRCFSEKMDPKLASRIHEVRAQVAHRSNEPQLALAEMRASRLSDPFRAFEGPQYGTASALQTLAWRAEEMPVPPTEALKGVMLVDGMVTTHKWVDLPALIQDVNGGKIKRKKKCLFF